MRLLRPKLKTYFTIGLSILTYSIYAQGQSTTLKQNSKFEQLLNEKRKINATNTVNDSYRIQIYSGKSEDAKRTLNEFRSEFKSIDATIIFNTPNYKVLVGNFETRIEAERNLVDIRKRYSNVFLIKPEK